MIRIWRRAVMLASLVLLACGTDGTAAEPGGSGGGSTGGDAAGSGGIVTGSGGDVATGGMVEVDAAVPSGKTIAVKSFALSNHSACAIDVHDRLVCWGAPMEAEPPAGVEFVRVHMSGRLSCGETASKRVHCWGEGLGEAPLHAPDIPCSQVSIGWLGGCLVADDGSGDLHCWGDVHEELFETSEKLQQIFVSPGVEDTACGIRLDGGGDMLGAGAARGRL